MRDELLAAILAAPHDDGPRLVYADYLLERNDPRGELIQLQCEVEHVSRYEKRYNDLNWRGHLLLREHCEEWTGVPYNDYPSWHGELIWKRGFVEELRLFELKQPDKMDALVEREPMLQTLILNSAAPEFIAAVSAWRGLAKIRNIFLTSRGAGLALSWAQSGGTLPPITVISKLLDSLPALQSLRLMGYDFSEIPTVFEQITIDRLVLECCCLGSARLAKLFKTKVGKQLIGLGLTHNAIGDDGLVSLTESAGPHLKELTIGSADIGVAGVAALVSSDLAKRLTHLDLGVGEPIHVPEPPTQDEAYDEARPQRLNRMTPDAVSALCNATLPALSSLGLSKVKLGVAGARSLANAPFARNLRRLDIDDASLDEAAVIELITPGTLTNVEELTLDVNGTSNLILQASMPAVAKKIQKSTTGPWPARSAVPHAMTERTAERLANAFRAAPELVEVEILHSMSWTSWSLVSEALATLRKLRSLNAPGLSEEPLIDFLDAKSEPMIALSVSAPASAAIASWEFRTELHELAIDNVDDAEAEAFAATADDSQSSWENLRKLELADGRFSDEGFALLITGNFPLLEHLHIRHTKITVRSIDMLYGAIDRFPNLTTVTITNNDSLIAVQAFEHDTRVCHREVKVAFARFGSRVKFK